MLARHARPLFFTLGGGIILATSMVMLFFGSTTLMMLHDYTEGGPPMTGETVAGWMLIGTAVLMIVARIAYVTWENHRDGTTTFARPNWRGMGAGVLAVVTGFMVFGLAGTAAGALIDSSFAAMVVGTGAAVASGVFVHKRVSRRR